VDEIFSWSICNFDADGWPILIGHQTAKKNPCGREPRQLNFRASLLGGFCFAAGNQGSFPLVLSWRILDAKAILAWSSD
jgi:hypothetical protein